MNKRTAFTAGITLTLLATYAIAGAFSVFVSFHEATAAKSVRLYGSTNPNSVAHQE